MFARFAVLCILALSLASASRFCAILPASPATPTETRFEPGPTTPSPSLVPALTPVLSHTLQPTETPTLTPTLVPSPTPDDSIGLIKSVKNLIEVSGQAVDKSQPLHNNDSISASQGGEGTLD